MWIVRDPISNTNCQANRFLTIIKFKYTNRFSVSRYLYTTFRPRGLLCNCRHINLRAHFARPNGILLNRPMPFFLCLLSSVGIINLYNVRRAYNLPFVFTLFFQLNTRRLSSFVNLPFVRAIFLASSFSGLFAKFVSFLFRLPSFFGIVFTRHFLGLNFRVTPLFIFLLFYDLCINHVNFRFKNRNLSRLLYLTKDSALCILCRSSFPIVHRLSINGRMTFQAIRRLILRYVTINRRMFINFNWLMTTVFTNLPSSVKGLSFLINTRSSKIRVPIGLRRSILLVCNSKCSIANGRLFFLFLTRLLSRRLIQSGRHLFTMRCKSSIVIWARLPQFTICLRRVERSALFRLNTFPIRSIPLLMNMFVRQLSNMTCLRTVISSNGTILIVSLRILPPLSTSTLLLRLNSVFEVVNAFLIGGNKCAFF